VFLLFEEIFLIFRCYPRKMGIFK